jgi:hypothetical protein
VFDDEVRHLAEEFGSEKNPLKLVRKDHKLVRFFLPAGGASATPRRTAIGASSPIPNFLITEYFVNFEARGREIARPAFEVREGYIAVPERPGLGIELDEAALARFPGRRFPARSLPAPASEGP